MLGEIEISPFFYIFDFMNGLFKKTAIGEKFDRLKQLSEVQLWLDSLDEETQDFIISLVQYAQLYSKGINAEEQVIGTYSQLTEEINPKKIAGTPYTLNDSGDFYKSMHVIPLSDGFEVDANDVKYSNVRVYDSIQVRVTHLFQEYGTSIVGLTEHSKDELKILILRKFISNVKKVL